jgi:hypothetical protein
MMVVMTVVVTGLSRHNCGGKHNDCDDYQESVAKLHGTSFSETLGQNFEHLALMVQLTFCRPSGAEKFSSSPLHVPISVPRPGKNQVGFAPSVDTSTITS